MTEKTGEYTVNIKTTFDGKSPEELAKEIDVLIGKLKEAKSLLDELRGKLASIKIEIID